MSPVTNSLIAEFVVDCSVTMAWCFEDETTLQTDTILDKLEHTSAFAPNHWRLEVANALRTAERRGRVAVEKSAAFLVILRALPITVDQETSERAWKEILHLSRLHHLTPHDAAYLELALRLGLPLATLDKELRQAAQTVGVTLL